LDGSRSFRARLFGDCQAVKNGRIGRSRRRPRARWLVAARPPQSVANRLIGPPVALPRRHSGVVAFASIGV